MLMDNNVCKRFKFDAIAEKKKILRQYERKERDAMKTETQKALPKKLPGSVQKQFVKCGKPTCRCSRGQLHGAYYYHFVLVNGRLRKRYLKPSEVKDTQTACAAYQEQRKQQIRSNREFWSSLRTLREELRTLQGLYNF